MFYVYGHYDYKGVLRYIGKGSKHRAWRRFPRSKEWREVFYGDYFPDVRIFAKDLTEEDAFKLETELIIKERLINALLLNVDDGGPGTTYWRGKQRDPEHIKKLVAASHTPEAIEKMRNSKRGTKLTEEHKTKIGDAARGKNHSQEWCDAISAAKKGRSNGREGAVFTEEHKRRISEARLKSDAVKSSYVKIQASRKANGTDRGWQSDRAKAVMCVETGAVFRSAKAAAEAMGCSDKHIQACCVGRRQRHAGYSWTYHVPA